MVLLRRNGRVRDAWTWRAGRTGARRAGVTALAVLAVTAVAAVMLAVLYHSCFALSRPFTLVRVERCRNRMCLTRLRLVGHAEDAGRVHGSAIPGGCGQEETAQHEGGGVEAYDVV